MKTALRLNGSSLKGLEDVESQDASPSGLPPRAGACTGVDQTDGKGRLVARVPQLAAARRRLLSPANKALVYGLFNVASASGIVFANKYVFTACQFPYTFALTWVHTLFTLAGMAVFLRLGMLDPKQLPTGKIVPIAAAYVAYIVLGNLSLRVNPVGFYQVMKIAVAPTVIALELVMFRRLPGPRILAAVLVVCVGIAVATVNDTQVSQHMTGIAVGVAATFTTALYQIWAGSKQTELKASAMQLLHAYTPHAALMLGVLVPLLEPVGWVDAAPGTLLGYHWTLGRLLAVVASSVLGVLVSLSTFLFIGATSSLTYNVVGHMKTVIILAGGCMFFNDSMPPKKLLGVSIAMAGIVWYTHLKMYAKPGPAGKGRPPERHVALPTAYVPNGGLLNRPGSASGRRQQANNARTLNVS